MDVMKKLLNNISKTAGRTAFSNADKDEFNIFRVLGVQTKEVIICRFIGELLDPNGAHKMGIKPLESFFWYVLEEETPSNLTQAQIELEERIDGDRRVDIVIHIENKVFPIEVKVWAGDQQAQLLDYFNYYKVHNDIDKIYYLTPYGWKPSKESIKGLDERKIKCRSFQNGIFSWLEHISNETASNSVKTAIQQFKEVISDMVIQNYTIEQIKKLLNIDSNNTFEVNETLQAAVSILNAKEVLTERIIVNYLQNALQVPNGYSLEEDKDKTIDKHSLLRIMKDDTAIAWVCVETNLYLVARKVKSNNLWKEVKENYVWQYLHPNGNGRKFPLKDLECVFEHPNKITLDELLFDIDTKEIDSL